MILNKRRNYFNSCLFNEQHLFWKQKKGCSLLEDVCKHVISLDWTHKMKKAFYFIEYNIVYDRQGSLKQAVQSTEKLSALVYSTLYGKGWFL